MRSELVFKALSHQPNRYELFRLVAKGTRRLHRPNTRVQDTTNEMLERFTVSAAAAEVSTVERCARFSSGVPPDRGLQVL